MSFASGLHEAKSKYNHFSCELYEHLERIFGEDQHGEDDSSDWYDNSLEMYECPPDMRATAGQAAEIWELGFERFWINHKDGSQTYYSRTGPPDGHHSMRAG